MDLQSTGSTITKQSLEDVFVATTLIEKKLEEKEKTSANSNEEKVEDNIEEPKELTIDDFINDFKL